MIRIALLDDYQSVALDCADWGQLSAGCMVKTFHDHLKSEDALAARLKDFDIVVALRERTPFPRSLLEKLPNLRLLVSTGMKNASIDFKAATDLEIPVCGTSSLIRSTVELTWGLILAVVRNIPKEHSAMSAGKWQETLGVVLEGKTLGLLGLGKIGTSVAEIGRAFRMSLIAWSQNLTQEQASASCVRRVEKEELRSYY